MPRTRPTTATRSPPTTPSSTSSTPIAGSTRCRRWPMSCPGIEQKKSVIYFSSGMSQQRPGQPGRSCAARSIAPTAPTCRSTPPTCAACRRCAAGGDATPGAARAARRRSPARRRRNQFSALAATQDTLTTMAEDTGGRAFFDSNSFGEVFEQGRRRHVGVLRARLLQHQPRRATAGSAASRSG